ncbi:peptidylprolyl isomerase [Niallia sp. CLA-SR-H024]|uniref:Peptidyl-prolyl cis-trans isomerase n=2 Tax=Bacillaceae TaxID=186817 RepID=A0ABV1EZH1_9BACI|nr:peptidylprolyl isomerase [Niallia sp. MER TA 168]MCM3364145.1 peptidylprolyl isomerase [Niallia sp. MER TA 168]
MIVFCASLLLLLTGCGTQEDTAPKNEENKAKSNTISPEDYPIVTITMEDDSKIVAELYPDKAPNTVNNFISLINKGFYDGLIFHRVIPDFMIQGGDPNGNGTGDPGYSIKGEFSENGFENDLKHERGVLSMARSQMPDSAGSQFFIMVADAPHLDGQYAPFGKVIEGMDVVDKIVAADRDELDKPLKEIKMKKVTVDTKGIDYEEPEKVKE